MKDYSKKTRTKILITGAAGRIGSVLIGHLRDRYDLVLTDVCQPENSHNLPFIKADITDPAAMRSACKGINTVLHLAADPRVDAPWESLLPNNLIGTYNVFQAAHEAGCRRIIFASSINVVGGYPKEVRVPTDAPVWPSNLYGVSKVWGEAVARFYADQTGLSCLCLRFGWVKNPDALELPPAHPALDHILTYRDLVKLIIASIEAQPDLKFGIFHGISDNRRRRLDLRDTCQILSYAPEDDAFALAEKAASKKPPLSVSSNGIPKTATSQQKSFQPTPQQELLLQASLWKDKKALEAWEAWKAQINWEDYLDTGSFRLLPLLFHNLQQHGVRDPLMQKLKGIYRKTWCENQIAFQKLAGLLQSFQNAGIMTLVLKGAALTVRHYQNHGLRPMNDFDVLVPMAQAPPAIALLKNLGWMPEEKFSQTSLDSFIATEHALAFKNAAGEELDLHWHVMHECRQPNADDDFWKAAMPTEINGVPTCALNPADQLLHVCVHGARWNEMPPIRWVADAMTIMRSSSAAIDWNRLLAQAQTRFLVLPMRDTLAYLCEAMRAPVPPVVLQKLRQKSTSQMERLEFAYKAGNYQQKPFGYMPMLWFDYLRSRSINDSSKLLGFARYLQQHWGARRLWHLPFYLLLTSRRRIPIVTNWRENRMKRRFNRDGRESKSQPTHNLIDHPSA